MKKEEVIDYTKNLIKKCEEAQRVADQNYQNNELMSTVNRIYYAMFYSVSALAVIKDGFSSSKHTGIKGYFDREIANKSIVSLEMKKFYENMFNKRITGDYDYSAGNFTKILLKKMSESGSIKQKNL